MDILRAKEILASLADGINPVTGEVLPPYDSCNQGDVLRALNTVLDYLPKQAEERPSGKYGEPWTAKDDQLLCELFDLGIRKSEICARLSRTEGGVAARLVRIGKITSREEFRQRK